MSQAMAKEFPQATAELAKDDDLQAVVLTGDGAAFCAGGDLDDLWEQTNWPAERIRRHMGQFYRAFLSVIDLPVPTIAAINGPAIGAGLALALGCDLRYASERAKLGTTYINIGLFPGMGATHLVPYHAGHAVAADMLLTGRLLTAQEALALGLVNGILPQEDLLRHAYGVAAEIAAKSPSAVRAIKSTLRARMTQGLPQALDTEALAQSISFASPEMRETLMRLRRR
jgi:enoyl-CoA hydratase